MLTTAIFVAIVLSVAALFVHAARLSTRPDDVVSRGWIRLVAIVFALWIVIPGLLASAGLLDRYSPLPAPALVLIAALTLGTIGLACSPFGARIAALPLAGLVGYQAFRIPVELVLHRLYVRGVIPVQMTYAGRNFDMVSGMTAAIIALALTKGWRSNVLVFAWNVLGLALLANIVAVAVLSTPVPFRLFMNEPANRLPSTVPYIWLPTFLVQAALFGHILVFRALRRPVRG